MLRLSRQFRIRTHVAVVEVYEILDCVQGKHLVALVQLFLVYSSLKYYLLLKHLLLQTWWAGPLGCCIYRWQLRDYVEDLFIAVGACISQGANVVSNGIITGLLSQLRGGSMVIAVVFGHSSHIKRAETSHYSLSIFFILPHLRVLLRQLTVTHDRTLSIFRECADSALVLTFSFVQLIYFKIACSQTKQCVL